jgi:hypothetical protein
MPMIPPFCPQGYFSAIALFQSTASVPEGIAPFVPLWDALGLNDGITAAPAYVTPSKAAVKGIILFFIAWLGFGQCTTALWKLIP